MTNKLLYICNYQNSMKMDETQETQEEIKDEFLLPDFEVEIDEDEEGNLILDTEEEVKEEEESIEEETPSYGEEADDTAIGLYETLVSKDILSTVEEFDGTWESLEAELDKLPETIATSIINELPVAARDLVEFAFAKGEVSHEDLKEYFSLKDQDYASSNATIDNDEDARAYLVEKMKAQKFDIDVIDATIDAMEDKGEDYLIKKANSFRSEEVTNLAQAKLKETKEEKQAAIVKQQEYFENINRELSALDYKESRKKEIASNLDPNIISRKNKAIGSSPKAIIQLADFYSYFDENTGLFNLEAYQSQSKSKAAKELKNSLMKDKFSSSAIQRGRNKSKSSNKGDELIPVFN